jgi:hypothetical protein
MTDFWDFDQCSVVEIDRRFRDVYCHEVCQRFYVLTAANTAPCSFLEIDRRFRGACCLHRPDDIPYYGHFIHGNIFSDAYIFRLYQISL